MPLLIEQLQGVVESDTLDFWAVLCKSLQNVISYDCCTITGKADLTRDSLQILFQEGEKPVDFMQSEDAFGTTKDLDWGKNGTRSVILNNSGASASEFGSMLFLPLVFGETLICILKFGSFTVNTYLQSEREHYLQSARIIASVAYCHYLKKQLEARDKQFESLLVRLNTPTEVEQQNEPVYVPKPKHLHALAKLAKLLPHVVESRNQNKLKHLARLLQQTTDSLLSKDATAKEE